MDEAAEMAEFLTWFGILTLAAALFAVLVSWRVRSSGSRIRVGVEWLLVIAALVYAAGPALLTFGLEEHERAITNGLRAFWWIAIAFTANAAIDRYIWRGRLARAGEPTVPKLLRGLAATAVYLGAVLWILQGVFDRSIATALIAASGAIAFVLGYSAQSTLAELFAGLSLSLSQSVRKGDWFQIDGFYGRVTDIDWRSISVWHPPSDSVEVFPNTRVAAAVLRDFQRPEEHHRLFATVVVEVSAPPDRVVQVLLASLSDSRYVMRSPAPEVKIVRFTDLGVEYRIWYSLRDQDDWWPGSAEVHTAVWHALGRAGFRMAVRRHDLETGLEPAGPVAPVEPDPAEIVSSLGVSPADANALLDAGQLRSWVPPERLARQGAPARALLLVSGRCEVTREGRGGRETELAVLSPGQLVGLEERQQSGSWPFTVRALEQCRALELEPGALRALRMERPELAKLREARPDALG